MATRPAYVYNGSGWDDIGDKRIGAENGDIPQASVEDLTSDLASKQADVMTTKGDLAAYGTAVDRLAIGTNGQILTADSGETLGVKWADDASGLVLISSTNVNATSVNIDNVFSSTYKNYKVVFNLETPNYTNLRFRNSSGTYSSTTYRWVTFLFSTAGAGPSVSNNNSGSAWLLTFTSASSGLGEVDIFSPNETKQTVGKWHTSAEGTNATVASGSGDLGASVTTAFTGINLYSTGTMTGLITVYGYRE